MTEIKPPQCGVCGTVETYKPAWPSKKSKAVNRISYGEKGDFSGWICKKCMNKND